MSPPRSSRAATRAAERSRTDGGAHDRRPRIWSGRVPRDHHKLPPFVSFLPSAHRSDGMLKSSRSSGVAAHAVSGARTDMAYAYRCGGPTATIGSRTSWGPVTSPTHPELSGKRADRPLSGNFDRIFNAFERTNAFEYVRNAFEGGKGGEEERGVGHNEPVVNRKLSSSYERADCNLAAQTPCSDDDDFYQEKILYSQARQLFPLQEDLADWINKTIGKYTVTINPCPYKSGARHVVAACARADRYLRRISVSTILYL
ncbi:hypothetical protein EVAR_33501_1 [Eumeta japonica]|uniref:Uncharacterized protein n=1 Tax=Eumeta variegata TaxID=151549 RepID=A0A4C1WI11_EUMVA|nr:hypothetical protein EVAR_33501_1 [Eumeta japonica]